MAINQLTIRTRNATIPLEAIHFSVANKLALDEFLKEFGHGEVLRSYNLPVDNKLLLHGHTGCGKTATAYAIASRLNRKIATLNLAEIVSSRLGETSKNMSQVFRKSMQEKGVLFLDEFDYIAKARDFDTRDSGEMTRVVNTVIQLIDHLPDDVLLIAATNHINRIDPALLRRFQLRLKFELPSPEELDQFYDAFLAQFPTQFQVIDRVYDLSYAEAKDKATKAVKRQVIQAEELK